jgi:hypothetical protein
VGAAIGVLLVSLLLIPFLGLLWATLCLAGIKLISFLIAGSIHEILNRRQFMLALLRPASATRPPAMPAGLFLARPTERRRTFRDRFSK